MTEQTQTDDPMVLLQAGLAKIKQQFLAGLPDTVAEFDRLMDCLYEDEDPLKIMKEIKFHAHKLHGRAGSFGLHEVGQLAGKVEHGAMAAIDGQRPINTESVEADLVTLLDQIDVELEGH